MAVVTVAVGIIVGSLTAAIAIVAVVVSMVVVLLLIMMVRASLLLFRSVPPLVRLLVPVVVRLVATMTARRQLRHCDDAQGMKHSGAVKGGELGEEALEEEGERVEA